MAEGLVQAAPATNLQWDLGVVTNKIVLLMIEDCELTVDHAVRLCLRPGLSEFCPLLDLCNIQPLLMMACGIHPLLVHAQLALLAVGRWIGRDTPITKHLAVVALAQVTIHGPLARQLVVLGL